MKCLGLMWITPALLRRTTFVGNAKANFPGPEGTRRTKTRRIAMPRFHDHFTGVSPEFLGLPAERQLQLQAGGRRFWRSEDSLRQNLPDSVRQRVEPEGWNPEESLRDDQQLLAQNP